MKKKIILLVSALIIISAIVFIYKNYSKPHRDINVEKTDFELIAKDLFTNFEENEIESNNKYLNKVLLLSGKIGELIKTQDNELTIVLKEPDELFGISCTLEDKNIKQTNFTIGNFIKIKGICKGYLTDVIIVGCVIIK